MEKKQLTGFIDKYHLAGNANSVRLDVKDNKLSCNFITDDQNVVGSVTMDNFDIDDVTLGVYATSQLTKLLTALDNDVKMRVNNADGTAFSINLSDSTTDVTFMLADLSVIRQVPAMKQLPDFNVKIKLTKDFADKFVKSKNALPETENFAIESDAMGTNMILNYSTLNTNRITWPTVPEGEQSDLKATCFSANLFKEILVANKEAEQGFIEVSSAGLARVSFTGKDYSSTYYLVQLQAN
jgi:hypothetical protein|tara:strand:- start:149 stop:868 length:720 start_codon:yes stop_codon:yes gene_type:complete